jgi:hypothetical protein
MEKDFELIHFHMYDPSGPSFFKSSKNDASKAFYIYCANKNKCDLYNCKECVCRNSFKNSMCPYGKSTSEEGYTRRSVKFRKWMNEIKSKYDNVSQLSSPSGKMSIVGEYVYLPYDFIDLSKNIPFLTIGTYFSNGSKFIKMDDFTIETVLSIIKFRPQALFGGEINDYQDKQVPRFIQHLIEVFPELYKELLEKNSDIQDIVNKFTNVGRKAYLKTTNSNCVAYSGKLCSWYYDGDYITTNYLNGLFNPIKSFDSVEVKIKVNDDSIVEILRDDQVNINTIFID